MLDVLPLFIIAHDLAVDLGALSGSGSAFLSGSGSGLFEEGRKIKELMVRSANVLSLFTLTF